jgi:transketolase
MSSSLDAWFDQYGLSSRVTCRRAQLELAREDRRVVSVENDLGLPAVPFEAEFPDRYVQAGIAEANMLSLAAGMAKRGFIPFVNSFASFATIRACEQLRLDIAYNEADVKVMGYYAGVSGGWAGPTHSCIEDLAITQAIPGITVLNPADSYEVYLATRAAASHAGPVYLRTGRAETPRVYEAEYEFEIGRAVRLRHGDDSTIIATGVAVVSEALDAAARLEERGISCGVLNVHTIKPLDEEAVVDVARGSRLIVTAEDHNVVGGLGSAVARVVLSEHPVPVRRAGIQDRYCAADDHEEILRSQGVTAAGLCELVCQSLR